jgi:hypothetical protein
MRYVLGVVLALRASRLRWPTAPNYGARPNLGRAVRGTSEHWSGEGLSKTR